VDDAFGIADEAVVLHQARKLAGWRLGDDLHDLTLSLDLKRLLLGQYLVEEFVDVAAENGS
jgi:hypothetical protein